MGHSAGPRGVVESTFSWEQCICSTLLMTHERFLYVDHVRYIWSGTIRGLSVGCVLVRFSVQGVHRFEST
jgi:hypothetical protein